MQAKIKTITKNLLTNGGKITAYVVYYIFSEDKKNKNRRGRLNARKVSRKAAWTWAGFF
jgi:hypothetical protein